MVLALRPRTVPREFLAVCALTYPVTISLNVVVWKYYYIQGLVLLFWSAYAPAGAARLRPGGAAPEISP